MPRVVVTSAARQGLARCLRFLAQRDRETAARAARKIDERFAVLEMRPEIGRPALARHDLRELVIGFGNSGYVALYRHDAAADAVYILAFRHQSEAGY